MKSAKIIQKELTAIENGELRSWGQVSALLDQIDISGYWHRDSDSFTEWLGKNAHTFRVKPAMLWRNFTSGRYLNQLRVAAKERGVDIPVLAEIPKLVSPENIELLAKLERIIPVAEFDALLVRALKGEVKRVELRGLWETYRPVLKGQTARGRNVVPPKINRQDPQQYRSYMEANLLLALKAAGSSWTGYEKTERFELYLNVTPVEERQDEGLSVVSDLLPAVAMVKPKGMPIEYHGIYFESFHQPNKLPVYQEPDKAHTDYLWLILRTPMSGAEVKPRPELIKLGVGMIEIKDGAVRVISKAGKISVGAERKANLMSSLILQAPMK